MPHASHSEILRRPSPPLPAARGDEVRGRLRLSQDDTTDDTRRTPRWPQVEAIGAASSNYTYAMTIAGVILAALAFLSLLLSGPGTRWGWWDFKVGLALFAVAFLAGA